MNIILPMGYNMDSSGQIYWSDMREEDSSGVKDMLRSLQVVTKELFGEIESICPKCGMKYISSWAIRCPCLDEVKGEK